MADKRLAVLCKYFQTQSFQSAARIPFQRLIHQGTQVSSHCSKLDKTGSENGNKVEVNGVNIYYERVGTGDHAVLLLPGALGYGYSRPPDRDWPLLFYQRDAEDAALLMQTLGFSYYSLLGWCDGGTTGMILAGSHPKNVRKFILWGANAYQTTRDEKKISLVSDIDTWTERLLASYLEIYDESYLSSQLKLWGKAVRRYIAERNGDICVGSLPNIKCKTLIINGMKDLLMLQEHPIFLQKNIPNCRMIDWPDGKHNLHMRYHQEFNHLAQQFLDEPDHLDMETGSQ